MADQKKFTNKLQDANVVIFGGSSGIGFGVAEGVLEFGGRVTITSSNPKRVDDAVARLQKSYPSASSKVKGVVCNLGDESNADANIEALLKSVAPIDHIVYTAADKLAIMPITDATIEHMKAAATLRVFGPLLVAKHAPKYITPGTQSSYTITSGSIGDRPIPNWVIPGTYAGGHQAMVRCLALDLAPLRVNLVSPGGVITEMWDAIMSKDEQEGYFGHMASKMPLKKVGRPEEVAEAFLYFMRDGNVTGTKIDTDSGLLLTSM